MERQELLGSIVAIAFMAVLTSGLTGCAEEGPAERMGERVDDAVSEAQDRFEDAREEVEEAAEEVREALRGED
ncbi:MAG: hypothetical protein PVF63_08590 [Gammaproteobacteria bacterium]|jgi:hypothetical protein